MEIKKQNSESGASVLEMLIVLAIGAVLVGVAISQFGNSKSQFTRQNIAREFKNNLERCRFDSVRRRADDGDYSNMAQIVLISQTSYEVRIDSNQDGAISSAEVRTVNFSNRSDTNIIPSGGTYPITIRFDRKGHITTDSAGVTVSPLFTICSGVCTAATTITPANGNVISISPTGTVSMLYGGDTIPPLAAPSVTSVGSNANINLMLTVLPDATATPTPTASTSPITSPTATASTSPTTSPSSEIIIIGPGSPTPVSTPVSTPTPQATPQPTPTPTPSPSLPTCSLNQKPGNPATCTCSTPRYLRTNGKCQ